MTILWVLNIEARYGIRHGSVLRYTNLSRGLLALGHRVYFVLTNRPDEDHAARNEFLERLRADGCFTGFIEMSAPARPNRQILATRFPISPAARDRANHEQNRAVEADFENLLRDLRPDACILSHRPYLFLVRRFNSVLPFTIDWCDSFALQQARQIRFETQSGAIAGLPSALKNLVENTAEERFYGRYAHANMMVSAADKKWFDRLNGSGPRNHVIGNGIAPAQLGQNGAAKDPNRLIFTGSMGFPPNYRAAIWFIDRVMPVLIGKNKKIHFVVAGQEPVPELLAKTSEHVTVTGLVPDISAEIARSGIYIAPLFSGSGFRNKIVEALNTGTFVIGTPMALEFLDDRLRSKLLTASSAAGFAEQILTFLANPEDFDQRLREAMQILNDDYRWSKRVQQLEALCAAGRN